MFYVGIFLSSQSRLYTGGACPRAGTSGTLAGTFLVYARRTGAPTTADGALEMTGCTAAGGGAGATNAEAAART